MNHLNLLVAATAWPLVLTIVMMMEFLRSCAGFYSGMPWYAMLGKFFIRVWVYAVALDVFVAYVGGTAVADALDRAVHGETVLIAPGMMLMIWGALAVIAVLAIGDVMAMLIWAAVVRRFPWHVFRDLELWIEYRAAPAITARANQVLARIWSNR